MRPERILVVDDDPNMLLLIDYNLSQRGYRVETSTDGPTGLRRALEGDFDLLILDVMLPGLSGFRITESLRGDPRGRDVPILLVTARSRMEDFEEASQVGATEYITKPFDPIALVEQVDSILRSSTGTGP
jgi:DNA-binding response OmpR family regulator